MEGNEEVELELESIKSIYAKEFKGEVSFLSHLIFLIFLAEVNKRHFQINLEHPQDCSIVLCMEVKLSKDYPNQLPSIECHCEKIEMMMTGEAVTQEIGERIIGCPMLYNIISEIEQRFKEKTIQEPPKLLTLSTIFQGANYEGIKFDPLSRNLELDSKEILIVKSSQSFHPAQMKWERIVPEESSCHPGMRSHHTLTYMPRICSILLQGGRQKDSKGDYCFNLETRKWKAIPPCKVISDISFHFWDIKQFLTFFFSVQLKVFINYVGKVATKMTYLELRG